MKRYYIILLLLAFSLVGCYKDKGNYDYSSVEDMTVSLSYASYPVAIGEALHIVPDIETEIPESDLTYTWQIYVNTLNGERVNNYRSFAEGRELNKAIVLNDLLPTPGGYSMRLLVKHPLSGREFYSSVFTVNVTSAYSGLMVLHGNDQESDIGLIRNRNFLVLDGIVKDSIIPHLYSENNAQKIPGRGKSIVQSFTYFMNNIDRATVVAITDQTGIWAKYADFSKGGDWNSMFNPGINAGKPEMYFTDDQVVYAVDNGKVFPRANNSYSIFPIPSNVAASYNAGSRYYMVSGRTQGFFFDKSLRGFVVSAQHRAFYTFASNAVFSQINTGSPFNLADMKADLLHLDRGGLGTQKFLAVMKENNGDKFLAEIDWNAKTNPEIPVAKYDMSTMPNMTDAKYFAFGENSVSMCYYATPSAVYRYTARDGESLANNNNMLRFQGGAAIQLDGEITMLKMLKPLYNDGGNYQVKYYNRNKILLVATYKNGIGTLHSFMVDQITGDVLQTKSFTGFDRIADAALKAF